MHHSQDANTLFGHHQMVHEGVCPELGLTAENNLNKVAFWNTLQANQLVEQNQ